MDTTFIWKYTRELLRFLAANLVKGKVWARRKPNPNTLIARITIDIKLRKIAFLVIFRHQRRN